MADDTKCPRCGRDLVRTASGKKLCAYAAEHPDGKPLIVAPRDGTRCVYGYWTPKG